MEVGCVLKVVVPGWGPSYHEQSQVKVLGLDPSWLLGTDQGLEKGRAEGSLPWVGPEWTSLSTAGRNEREKKALICKENGKRTLL